MNEPLKNMPQGEPIRPTPLRTPLGQRLAQIRERIVASGEPLLSWPEIEREIAERGGEAERRP